MAIQYDDTMNDQFVNKKVFIFRFQSTQFIINQF